MYEVLKRFEDLKDGRHVYNPGDTFPREGLEVDPARFLELSTDKNRRKIPLIRFVGNPEPEKPVELVKQAEESGSAETESEPVPEEKPKRGRKKANAD